MCINTYNNTKPSLHKPWTFYSVLAALCLPLMLMRAAMMELELLVVRKKHLNQDIKVENGMIQIPNLGTDINSKELKFRVYGSIFWSIAGVVFIAVFIVLIITFICISLLRV